MKLTGEQLRLMAHALGYRVEAGSWPLEPYRNHFISSGARPALDRAVDAGLAVVTQLHDPPLMGDRMYRITEDGRRAVLDQLSSMKLSERYSLARGEA